MGKKKEDEGEKGEVKERKRKDFSPGPENMQGG